MIFISATRLRVKSLFILPAFFLANKASVKALVNTDGFLEGRELIDKRFTFWTLTAWRDIEAMKRFRNSEGHRKAMQKLPSWCDEAAYVHWAQESSQLPDWNLVHSKMINESKLTKVKKPSLQQHTRNYPAPRWTKASRILKPTV